MGNVKSVFCLMPCLVLATVWTPTAGRVAVAQQAPGSTEAQGTHVIEVVKGSRVDRVVVGADDRNSAVDAQSVASGDDLARKIEIFKGGEVVVLTVVDSDPGMPIAARIDSVKKSRGGPTNLLPIRLGAAEAAPRGDPTSLLPGRPRAAGAVLRGETTRPMPSQSPVAGAALRDTPAGGGVLVASVEEGSPASRDGLRQADVIESVYRTPVRDVAELETELAAAGRTAVLQVWRSGNEVVVVLRR